MAETKKLRIFLCHARADESRANRLYDFLLKHGVQPWMPVKDISAGQDWRVEIDNAMRTSDVILGILSQDSIKEEGHVQKQLKYAVERSEEQPSGAIFLIPLKLEECELPEGKLSRLLWVNWYEKKGPQQLMSALIKRAERLGSSQVKSQKETDSSPDLSKGKSNAQESWEDIIIRLNVERDNLKEQLKNQSYLYELQTSLLTNERDDFKGQISDYKSKVELLIKDREDLKGQISDHMAQIASLMKERDDLKEQISDYKSQVKLLLKDRDDLKGQIFDHKAQIASLTKERDDFKEQVSDYKSQVKSLNKEIDELEGQISDQKAQIASLMKEKENFKGQISDYKSQVKMLTQERNGLKERVSSLTVQIDQLNKHDEALQEEIDQLKKGTYHGLTFIEMKQKLADADAKIPHKEMIEKIEKEYADKKDNDDDDAYKAIQYFVSEHTLLGFYWVFSRLLDYGISKSDADSIPAIHSNLKRLIDFGLVQRENKELQTVFVNTESGKNFLLQLIMTRDSVAKEIYILG